MTFAVASSSASAVLRQRVAVAGRRFSTAPVARLAAAAGPSEVAGPWADRLTEPRLNRYLVVAEDHADAGANARRFEVRERHLEQARNGKRVGRIELGGALLRKDFNQIDQEVGPGPHMGGSVLVVLGESIEDVRARVMQDEYVQGNVWNVDALKIYPFLQAPWSTPMRLRPAQTKPQTTRRVRLRTGPTQRSASFDRMSRRARVTRWSRSVRCAGCTRTVPRDQVIATTYRRVAFRTHTTCFMLPRTCWHLEQQDTPPQKTIASPAIARTSIPTSAVKRSVSKRPHCSYPRPVPTSSATPSRPQTRSRRRDSVQATAFKHSCSLLCLFHARSLSAFFTLCM